MAKVLKITKEHTPGLYDSDGGATLKTEKVVDITDDCPNGTDHNRFVLLFTRAKRGRIVQIAQPYTGEVYMGAHTHFFVDEIDRPIAERDDTLASLALRMGLPRPGLVRAITQHAPA